MDIIKHLRIPQNSYIICIKDTRMDIKKTQISYLFIETDNVLHNIHVNKCQTH